MTALLKVAFYTLTVLFAVTEISLVLLFILVSYGTL